jgi:PAS domain S-box-containing protein
MNVTNWQTIDIIITIAISVVSVYLAIYAWNRRIVPGALWFSALLIAVAWVNSWYALEAAAGDDLAAYITFSKFEYIGLTLVPVLWLGFALSLSGRERPYSNMLLTALLVIPVITVILAFTNDFHGLIYQSAAFDTRANPPIFIAAYGAGFWIFTIYSYIVFLLGSVLLVGRGLGTWQIYRSQAILFLVGTALPWISNLFEIFDIVIVPGLYLNAILLGVTMLCFAFALFRFRLLDLVPLAYESILNQVPEGIIVVDTRDRIVALNNYMRPFLDHPETDPIGQPIAEAFSKSADDFKLLRGLLEYRGEHIANNRVTEVRISPVVNRQGQQRGRLFIITDITERAQAQHEQQIFAETLRDIGSQINSTLDMNQVLALIADSVDRLVPHSRATIMVVDSDGYTTRVRQHHGYPPEAAARLEQTAFDYRANPTFAKAANDDVPTIVSDTSGDSSWQMIAGLENIRSLASAPIRVDGSVIGFINVGSSIPEALKQETGNRLQILAQQASIAIKNARLYEQTLHQSEELQRGVTALTVTQRVYQEIGFSFNVNHLLEIALDAVLRLSRADSGFVALMIEDELRVVHSYGSYSQVSLSNILQGQLGIIGKSIDQHGTVILSNQEDIISALQGTAAQIGLPLFAGDTEVFDNLYGMIVIETLHPERFTDERVRLLNLISDRVAVALANARLLEAVQTRATELQNLYERVSGLEQLKSDMIRIAAHDLKNPLTVLIGYLEFLVDMAEGRTEREQMMFTTMSKSAQRMNQIIQDFLSLERIEQIAQEQTSKAFDLNEVVGKAVDEFAGRAAYKGQQFEIDLPDVKSIVNADSVQIYEAISNFVGNAIKYTPEGGQVKVQLKQENGFALFEVQDTGHGISPEGQSKLFAPFSRVDSEKNANIEGTGLGLYLAKNIVERNGGTIIFHSVEGEGSTFGFRVPMRQAAN